MYQDLVLCHTLNFCLLMRLTTLGTTLVGSFSVPSAAYVMPLLFAENGRCPSCVGSTKDWSK